MKLYITDHADPSVGMFPCTWEVEVPFSVSDTDILQYKTTGNLGLDMFRDDMRRVYQDYCDGRCEAYYEFENTND